MILKRIGIISLYYRNSNYGGQLQAYALPRALSKMGFECDQIEFQRDLTGLGERLQRLRSNDLIVRLRAVGSLGKFAVKTAAEKVANIPIQKNIQLRKNSFRIFEESIAHTKAVFDINSIALVSDSYDAFICGSDVIWNAGVDPYISALGFAAENKTKIAYAPSLGGSNIPDGWFRKYKKYLTRLDSLSVREESIAEELRSLMPEREIVCAVDPTLLLTADEWNECCSPRPEKGYALCYLLGDSKRQRAKAAETSKQLGLKLLTFPHITENTFKWCDYKFGDIENFDADALDFISLIHDADLVITDSFHAVVFSTIFHKRFVALDRINGNQASMGGRVRNLLRNLSLSGQLASLEDSSWLNATSLPNYSEVDRCRQLLREQSLTYLRRSLSNEA
jgi:hypothetical protein